ncbi:TIGR03086 family protein [Actinomadura graeca]|uniref:TIGR03086 family protein n=1 Tax=Actinomadura graeca TaxID=2750812 RepID=A0ABX8QQY2_9ACTN|nr:TIGR03086 family metal-binding protein [Actinomadura graeca]QXJ19812.1 TIGR03086 family protein [Actinomadura graeca]
MVPGRFVRALEVFEAVLAGVPAGRWESPSPCEGWCAVDVAGHVMAGLLAVREVAAGRPFPGTDPDVREVAGADPVATWRSVRADLMAALGPGTLERRVELAVGVETTVGEWLDRYPLELLVHAWDLGQATGRPVVFPPDLAAAALETARRFAPQGRAAGMIGPERAVPGGADDQARLLAVFGRGPSDGPSDGDGG